MSTTEATTPFNIERLREAVAWAAAEAKKKEASAWNQGTWAEGEVASKATRVAKRKEDGEELTLVEVNCGSAFCVAGHVCAAQGDRFVVEDYNFLSPGEEVAVDYVVPKGKRTVFQIGERAEALLGITEEEAEELFFGGNTIQDIKRIARRIAKNHGETL